MHHVEPYRTAGIDVSKATLELGLANSPAPSRRTYNNDDPDCEILAELLKQLGVDLVVVESTGGYERRICRHLHAIDVPVAVVQAARVRYFARSKGILAKSDPIDAQLIADYGHTHRPVPTAPKSTTQRELRALAERRDQLLQDRIREQNRLESCDSDIVAQQLRQNIHRLNQQIQEIEYKIDQTIDNDPWMKNLHSSLQTISGIGPVTATVLVTYLPELGRLNRQAVAALSGLAPYDRDSGAYRGKRTIFGGRARLREAMYMAAVTASRHNEHLKPFYQRLKNEGKDSKVALIACARKLLVHANSMAARLLEEHAEYNASTGDNH